MVERMIGPLPEGVRVLEARFDQCGQFSVGLVSDEPFFVNCANSWVVRDGGPLPMTDLDTVIGEAP